MKDSKKNTAAAKGDQEGTPKQKAGRRGDPRMNKAVEVRLADPNISLIDALRKGGFKFPEGYCNNMVCDEENVPLLQRKNQLTRRLRSLKKQQARCCEEAEAAGRICTKKACESESCMANGLDGKQSDGEFKTNNGQSSPHINSVMDMVMNGRKREHEAPKDFQADSNLLQYRNLVPVSNNYPQCRGQEATLNQSSGRHYFPPTLECRNHDFPYQLGATDQSYPNMNLAYMASNQPSNSTSMSRDQNNQLSSPMDKALNQFRIEFSSLIKKCMITSGFALEHTEECDDVYLNFLERALSGENHRLSRIKSRLYTRSGSSQISPPAMGIDGAIGAVADQKKLQGSTASTASTANMNHLQSPTNMGHSSNAAEKTSQLNVQHGMNAEASAKRQKCSHESTEHHHSSSKDNHHHSHAHNVHEHSNACQNSKHHYHNLECGHMPIIHKPKDGPLHVDFVVNGVVECYQGILNQPAADSKKLWPSRLQELNNSLSSASDIQNVTSKEEEQCADPQCEVKNKTEGVDFYDFNQLDLTGPEWDLDGMDDLKGIFKSEGGEAHEPHEDVKNFHEC